MDHTNAPHGHILLVEDEPGIREHLTHLLEKAGFTVTAPTDGAMALEFLRTGKFDLILLDIGLQPIGAWTAAYRHVVCAPMGTKRRLFCFTGQYLSEADKVVGFEWRR